MKTALPRAPVRAHAACAPTLTMTGATDDDETLHVELTCVSALKDAIYRYCPPDHPDRRPVLRMTAIPAVRECRPPLARWSLPRPWRFARALGA